MCVSRDAAEGPHHPRALDADDWQDEYRHSGHIYIHRLIIIPLSISTPREKRCCLCDRINESPIQAVSMNALCMPHVCSVGPDAEEAHGYDQRVMHHQRCRTLLRTGGGGRVALYPAATLRQDLTQR